MGLVTIGLSGGDGGKMKSSGLCDHILIVPTNSIHRIQAAHLLKGSPYARARARE